MKKVIINAAAIFALVMIFLPTATALAEDNFTLLAPLGDGLTTLPNNKNILKEYLPKVFDLAIGLAAAAAVLMIVIGGFQYMSSDAIQGKSAGKERIKNALYSLVLIIGSWIILNTINPKLLEINLNIEDVSVAPTKVELGGTLSAGTGKVLPGYTLTQDQINTNNNMRTELQNRYGISTNAGPCANGQTSGCTNLVGMTPTTFKGLVDLKSTCNCSITIIGGTEGGHASHGPNLPPVDLAFDSKLENYILQNKIKEPQQTSLGPVYTSKVGDRNATFLKESNHWHVVFE